MQRRRPYAQARRILVAYLPYYLAIGAFYLAVYLALGDVDPPGTFDLLGILPYLQINFPIFLIGAAFFAFFRLAVFRTDVPARQRIRQWLFQTPWLGGFALRFVPAMFGFYLLQRVFLAFKPHISTLLPFSWDPMMADWDRFLLFGYDAWQITHAVFPTPLLTSALDQLYILWFFTVFSGTFIASMQPLDSRKRMAHLVALVLIWGIGGAFLATLFSSVGPVYYERLFGDPLFVPLIQRLNAQAPPDGLVASVLAESLWKGHNGDPGHLDAGISAFPSIHVAMAVLNVCLAAQFGRAWGWAAAIFAALIVIGSVHLAWHYLVDGIAGIAIGWVAWVAAWRFSGWWLRFTGVPAAA